MYHPAMLYTSFAATCLCVCCCCAFCGFGSARIVCALVGLGKGRARGKALDDSGGVEIGDMVMVCGVVVINLTPRTT